VCRDCEGGCHFLEESLQVEGDGHRIRTETSNRRGNWVWIDPGAAKAYDVVDGDGSLCWTNMRTRAKRTRGTEIPDAFIQLNM
jgi:hypothetical protein